MILTNRMLVAFQLLSQIIIIHSSDTPCNDDLKYKLAHQIEFVPDRVYGCQLEKYQYYSSCGKGYHLCKNVQEAEELGLTRDLCLNSPPNEEGAVFRLSSTYTQCPYSYSYTLWACFAGSELIGDEDTCGAMTEIPSHLNSDRRGGLCCSDVPQTGCANPRESYATHHEISANELYACPQSIECNKGYHICQSSIEMEGFGFTAEICDNTPKDDEFFAIIPNEDSSELYINEYMECFNDLNPVDNTGYIFGCTNSNIAVNYLCNAVNGVIAAPYSDYPAESLQQAAATNPNLAVFCCTDEELVGCAQPKGRVELIAEKVYGCQVHDIAKKEVANTLKLNVPKEFALNTFAENVCQSGYHACRNAEELTYLGITSDECGADELGDIFYASLEGFPSSSCGKSIFGCSANPNANCGVLNSKSTQSILNVDGLLCCKDGKVAEGTGCKVAFGEQKIISNKIYACPGKYGDIRDAEKNGCAPFYHVCNSANELKAKGFTDKQCSNITYTTGNEFYATMEGIATNNAKCDTEINGVFGCSLNPNNNECSPLNDVIIDGTLSDADGILCCADGDWKDIDWIDIPYMVSLRWPDGQHYCGGSILTLDGYDRKGAILTAAHCITTVENHVFIGCTSTGKKCDNDGDLKDIYNIEAVTSHPQFHNPVWENDIQIIYLDRAITCPGAVGIVIESDPMIAENNGKVKLTGYWGEYYGGRGGSDTNNLQIGYTNIMTRKECQNYFNDYSGDYTGDMFITDAEFCVKDDVGTDGMVMSCKGDSGSPVLYQGKQIGIVSWGLGECDPSYPDVFTYVPSYYQWITTECGKKCMNGNGYIGCYYNNLLGPVGNTVDGSHFDVEKCRKKCNGHLFFGLKDNGNVCFCEDDYESATQYGESHNCRNNQFGGTDSFSFFAHDGSKQISYIPDEELQKKQLKYGPGKGINDGITYTIQSCRISCSTYKYFSLTSDGKCYCDNEIPKYSNEYNNNGIFKNVLRDGIEINVNCDNYLNSISFINENEYSQFQILSLESGEEYPYSDWSKTQKVTIPNSANCGKVRIDCSNAKNDNGPAGIQIGIKYKNKYISSNQDTINDGIISLVSTTGNSNQIVVTSRKSKTKLNVSPYDAKWIWTCGENQDWYECGKGVENTFEIDLCKLSVANSPNFFDYFMPKSGIYLFVGIISIIGNVLLLFICCYKGFKSKNKYTQIKKVNFSESDIEEEEI